MSLSSNPASRLMSTPTQSSPRGQRTAVRVLVRRRFSAAVPMNFLRHNVASPHSPSPTSACRPISAPMARYALEFTVATPF
jgi:hypothetical protein